MSYAERWTAVPHVQLWRRRVTEGAETTRILPDGCLDLLWDGERLLVAGPDTAARLHRGPAGLRLTALRLAAGTGPALLGVAADELRDRTVDLAELWPARAVRALTDTVAADPLAGLEAAALRAAAPDPLGPRLHALVGAGTPVRDAAAELGLSSRQLLRRCEVLFGYGPRHLRRVLRVRRALAEAAAGRALADVAHRTGYADQAHLSREVRALAGLPPVRLLRER